MTRPRISLEQWRALVTVVDAGSYAAAAERLHKTQSTVSYGIRRIEEILGIPVFEREGRRSALTESGRVLYRRGRALLAEAERVEESAAALSAGWEPELHIAAEILFPTWLLLDCLAAFAKERPETRIELYESVMSGTEELLREGRTHMAICSNVPAGFVGDPLLQVRFIAVAAPTHPLHQLRRTLTLEDLREHRHLFVRDTGTDRQLRTGRGITEARWTVSSKATSIRAACKGLGFAWYAEDQIREELESGTLVPLPLEQGSERWTTLYLAMPDPDAAGPGTLRLAEIIHAAVAKAQPAHD